MRRLVQGEAAVWALLTCLALGMAAASFGFGITGEGGQVGPGFLPLVSGVLLAGLSAATLVGTLRRTAPEQPVEQAERRRVRTLWIVFAMLLAALLLVPVTGFLVAFGLLVFAVSAFVERRRPVPALVVAVVATLVIYAVFVLFLNVPLPGGLLGIGGEG
jgi:putative tricarboxylic transport membrane protein